MTINPIYTKILTDETLRETIAHGNEEYPFSYYLEDIWQFDFHCIDWHWHPEVEFVFVEKGSATLSAGSNRYVLTPGTGVFINTQVIHRFESTEHVIIPNIVFSPSLLAPEGSLIYQKYIRPVLNSSIDCQIFSTDHLWQKQILDILLSVFALQEAESPCEIQTVQLLFQLWDILCEHLQTTENTPSSTTDAHTQAQLQIMMQYMHTHYQHRILLDDIARTVNLSKSSVLHIFHNYLHMTPVRYLIHYRLKCAAKLLNTTENSISFIAQNTGFDNIGYFCRKFKELYQLTPSEYRRAEKIKLLELSSKAENSMQQQWGIVR